MAGTVPREVLLEQSVTDVLRQGLFVDRQLPADRVELVESFDATEFDAMPTLDRSYVALGFNFDRGGEPLELGSTLVQRRHMIEVFVLGDRPDTARHLAYTVRDIIEDAHPIPLKDVTVAGQPVIDHLQVDPIGVDRQPVADPKPWEENVWLVTVPIIDELYL